MKQNMKTLFFPLLLLSSTVIFAQNTQIQLSFQKDYPDARDVRWNQTNNQWHGTYRDRDNRDVNVYYDQYGNRVDTHIPWDRRQVPPDVDHRIERRYHVNEYRVERIERPSYRPLFQIRIGTRSRPVYMDEDGRKRRYHDRHD
jgi:YD repeat-containing protein